ncbi:MAG: hypothetical protein ACE5HC_16965, partial [Candidatus Binatia bacterium]
LAPCGRCRGPHPFMSCNDNAMRQGCTWDAAVAEDPSGMFGLGDSRPERAFFPTSYIRIV